MLRHYIPRKERKQQSREGTTYTVIYDVWSPRREAINYTKTFVQIDKIMNENVYIRG